MNWTVRRIKFRNRCVAFAPWAFVALLRARFGRNGNLFRRYPLIQQTFRVFCDSVLRLIGVLSSHGSHV